MKALILATCLFASASVGAQDLRLPPPEPQRTSLGGAAICVGFSTLLYGVMFQQDQDNLRWCGQFLAGFGYGVAFGLTVDDLFASRRRPAPHAL